MAGETLSIVIPIFNEQEILDELRRRLIRALEGIGQRHLHPGHHRQTGGTHTHLGSGGGPARGR